MEKIREILRQLNQEVTRGMTEGKIGETIEYEFYVPQSRNVRDGVVHCTFLTRPLPRRALSLDDMEQRLKVVSRISQISEPVPIIGEFLRV